MKTIFLIFSFILFHDFSVAQTDLTALQMIEKYLDKEYFKRENAGYSFRNTDYKAITLKNAKSFKVVSILLGSSKDLKYPSTMYRYIIGLKFDTGELENVDDWEIKSLVNMSDTKEERNKLIDSTLKIKGESYFTCWNKKEIIKNPKYEDMTYFYEVCRGDFFYEKKIFEKSNKAEFILANRTKYKVVDVDTKDFGLSFDYTLQSEKGERIVLDDKNFATFVKIAESNSQTIDRLEKEKQKKIYYSKLVAKYSPTIGKLIIDGKVKIGMTKEMCKLSWGEPDDINKTITRYSVSEQWVYGSSYLYFENGKLVTIQN